MNLKLEAIVVPVSDVDRAKKFCSMRSRWASESTLTIVPQPMRRRWASGNAAK
jgi:hypothetical protein